MLANIRKNALCMLFASLSLFSAVSAKDSEVIEQHTISAVGTLYPLYKSTLGSVVSGRVDEIFVEVGDGVTKGQPLLTLDRSLFVIAVAEAQAAVSSAKVEVEDAGRNYDRMKKLFEKPEGRAPSISQKRFEDAKTRHEQAEVGVQKAEEMLKRAQTNLNESTIKAPYDGVITKRFVHPGEPVNATPVTKLLEMLSIDDLYVEFSVPQLHMSHLQVGTPVLLDIEGSFCENIPATINRIYPDIDERTRSIKCRAVMKNVDRKFHPGALVRVVLPLKEAARASL
jgi:membrane fusion protein (multidrug efflux system)